jgi:hypothetical protein
MPTRQEVVEWVTDREFLRTSQLGGAAATLVREVRCPINNCPGASGPGKPFAGCDVPSGCHYLRRDALVIAIHLGQVTA